MSTLRSRIAGLLGTLGFAAGCQAPATPEIVPMPEIEPAQQRPSSVLTLIVGLDARSVLAQRLAAESVSAAGKSEESRILSEAVDLPLSITRIASGNDLVVRVDMARVLGALLSKDHEGVIDIDEVALDPQTETSKSARVRFKAGTGSGDPRAACRRAATILNANRKNSPLLESSLGEVSIEACPGSLVSNLDLENFKRTLMHRLSRHPSIRYVEENVRVDLQKEAKP